MFKVIFLKNQISYKKFYSILFVVRISLILVKYVQMQKMHILWMKKIDIHMMCDQLLLHYDVIFLLPGWRLQHKQSYGCIIIISFNSIDYCLPHRFNIVPCNLLIAYVSRTRYSLIFYNNREHFYVFYLRKPISDYLALISHL